MYTMVLVFLQLASIKRNYSRGGAYQAKQPSPSQNALSRHPHPTTLPCVSPLKEMIMTLGIFSHASSLAGIPTGCSILASSERWTKPFPLCVSRRSGCRIPCKHNFSVSDLFSAITTKYELYDSPLGESLSEGIV